VGVLKSPWVLQPVFGDDRVEGMASCTLRPAGACDP
jgi:hypothetical protein